MTRYSETKLLIPPREEESIYPYRRVWRSLTTEIIALFGITLVLYVLLGILGFSVPRGLWQIINLGLALLPALLWGMFSWWQETRVPQPRRQLLSIVIITALATNAVAIPLINWLKPDDWLALEGTLDRMLGYAFSIGIIQIAIQYAVVRFITWPDSYRVRNDAIAYCLSAAIGYISVWNVHTIAAADITPYVVALRVFSTSTLALMAAMILAYGFAELRYNPQLYFVMPVSIIIAAIVIGFGITFRAGFVSGSFTLGIGGTRQLFGLGFSAGLLFAGLMGLFFLFNVAERRNREADEGSQD